MADLISNIVDKSANEQVLLLDKQLQDLHKTAQTIEIKIGAPKDIQEFLALTAQLKTVLGEITTVTKAQAQAQLLLQKADTEKVRTDREALKLQDELLKSQEKLNKKRDKATKQAAELTDDYKLLAKAYNDAAAKAKNLGVTLGATHPEFLKAAENANKMRERLQQVESAVGQFQRQVGNYNMVGMQFNQILRELPNAGISARTFIQAISNNITGFAEAVQKARKDGESWGSIMKTMGTSMFGLVGIINLAAAALTLWSTHMGNSKSVVDLAEESNKKYQDSLKSIEDTAMKNAYSEVARAKILYAIATDETESRKKRNEAVNELQRLYPNYLANIDDEAIKSGKAKDTINELTKAILQNAVAKAAGDKYGAAYLKMKEDEDNYYKAVQERQKAQAEYDKARAAGANIGNPMSTGSAGVNLVNKDFEGALNTAKQNEKALNDVYDNSIRETNRFMGIAQDAMSKVPDLFTKPLGTLKKDKPDLDKELDDWIATMLDANGRLRMVGTDMEKQLEELQNVRMKQPNVKEANPLIPKPTDKDKEAWDKFYNYIEQKGVQAAGQIFNAFADATKKKSQNEIERLDKEKDYLDRNLSVEIDKIKVSELSAKDKEKAITKAQAETEAHRKQIEAQQLEAKRRAAKADRDAAIATILLNTAEAVIKALTDKTVPYPVRVGYAIAAGAIGATQLAVAKSAPLPQYKDGTFDHMGTKAVVGDGGERELVIEPSGKMYMTPNKPTVVDLPKHSKVFNQSMIMELSGLFTPQLMKSLESRREMHDKKLGYIIENSIDRLNNTIKKNRPIVKNSVSFGNDTYRNSKTGRA